ncbi:hypothetical protein CYY_001642 [Polysphondylium violaceum]|uniref:Pescadillo homolog n=1 Tax=Polysphondylium violaceum TaxID=133409 RepID=A0A8J4Q0S6_9MYCE|nr:hypothetical protein CYY_001642 [Polysphondylium violaceum]
MGGIRKFKKGEKGENLKFMTRNEAIKKLQVSLKVFRKLCILKGIHPRDPKKKLKGKNKTYYYAKDIRYLQHEKIIDVIRSRKTFKEKEKKLIARKQFGSLKKLKENRPMITLDHIIKERYPTFQDALKDLDDCLCLVHLFASMDSSPKIRENQIISCQSLVREFQYYVIKSKSLKKVFVSVKGVYYQADIMGETVTWLAPINYLNKKEKEVDYGVMISFLEFYQALLKFVNYRLFTALGMSYPPKVDQTKLGKDESLMSVFNDKSNTKKAITAAAAAAKKKANAPVDPSVKSLEAKISKIASKQAAEEEVDEEEEQENKLELNASGVSKDFEDLVDKNADELSSIPSIIDQSTLFVGYHFFLSREVPRHMLEFIIHSFGGRVSCVGGAVAESDQSITHQIVDRGETKKLYHTREYIQPQWVFDSVNSKTLLPISEYAPGVIPPPHLSPFVEYDEDTYIPARKAALDQLINQKGFDKLIPLMNQDNDDQDMDDDQDQDTMDQDKDGEDSEDDDEDDDENEDDLASIESRYMEELRDEKDKKRKFNQDDDEDEEEEEEDDEDEDDEEEEEEEEEQEQVEKNLSKKERDQLKKQKQIEEEQKLAELMIRKKDKWIYNKVKETNAQKKEAIKNLEEKRNRIEQGKDVNGNVKGTETTNNKKKQQQQQPPQKPKQQQSKQQPAKKQKK